MTGDSARYDVDGHVATLTLDRRERLNALTSDMVERVLGLLERASGDDRVRVLVLTGAGRGFCAGGDLQGIADGGSSSRASRDERIRTVRRYERTTELLRTMPKVTIAAVNGPCAGAGLSWACAADLRYAAASAVFTTAFAAAGQSGDYGGTWTLRRLVGEGRARELYLLAERIDAGEAHRIGLVNRVFDDEAFEEEVWNIAGRLAAFAPLALRAIKANLNDAAELALTDLLDREAERFVANQDTVDAGEAARAFVEGRAPRFEGR